MKSTFLTMAVFLAGASGLIAEVVTLRNKAGKAIEATINAVSADAVEITSEGKDYKIPLAKLDDDSVKLIQNWKTTNSGSKKDKEPSLSKKKEKRIVFELKDKATERYTFTLKGDSFTDPKAGAEESSPYFEVYSAFGGGEIKIVLTNTIAPKISLTLITKKEGSETYSKPEIIILPSLGIVNGRFTGPYYKTLSGDVKEIVIYDVKKAK